MQNLIGNTSTGNKALLDIYRPFRNDGMMVRLQNQLAFCVNKDSGVHAFHLRFYIAMRLDAFHKA
jgi:hypothetical protein